MGLIHGPRWWWEYFKSMFFDVHTSIKGSIVLSYGMQSLNIPIDPDITPIDIYVNCLDMDVPVCAGGVSLVAARLNDDHTFTLTANIASNSCNVGWMIEYEPVIN